MQITPCDSECWTSKTNITVLMMRVKGKQCMNVYTHIEGNINSSGKTSGISSCVLMVCMCSCSYVVTSSYLVFRIAS